MKLLSIIKPAAMLTLFCVVTTALLAGTNLITKDRIAELERKKTEESMTAICAADEYKLCEGDGFTYYEAVKNGATECYIFTNAAGGYGGDVSVMTGILPDGTVKGIEVLDVTSETAGLGQNANKENFTSQFTGKTSGIIVQKYGAEGNEVNAVTGATISSKGVTACVNTALEQFKNIKTGGK